MGALSSTYVRLSTPLEINFGSENKPFVLQQVIDNIVPGILPLLAVFGIYLVVAETKSKLHGYYAGNYYRFHCRSFSWHILMESKYAGFTFWCREYWSWIYR
ncbi:PTS system mannose/fructose/sorbose family transporter subunit IID [Klebsiella pneumoniae]|uniref:PTS system mannose/fructose/sorbose family transporter subunit IID n=1 Tax=Klebsiella pneumoniae TaxID=573 RepID=UPI003F6C2C55